VSALAKTSPRRCLLALAATGASAQISRGWLDAPDRGTKPCDGLDHNPDLSADRWIRRSATRASPRRPARSGPRSYERPTEQQIQPPTSFLIPTATQTDAVTSSAGVSQRLPRFGTSYSVSWNAVHTDSNSFLNSYNPLLTSGLSWAVPALVRDLSIDRARQQLRTSRSTATSPARACARASSTRREREERVRNLVSAISNVEARQSRSASRRNCRA